MGSTIIELRVGDPCPTTLPMVAGLAAYEALVPMLVGAARLELKWPNDVLLAGTKLAGILLERSGDHVICGVGVNLAMGPALADRGASHLAARRPAPDRDMFAHGLADSLARELGRWRQDGAGESLTRWLAAAHPVGSLLSVHDDASMRVTGRFAGLEPDGGLRIALADGTIRIIRAGDVVLEESGT